MTLQNAFENLAVESKQDATNTALDDILLELQGKVVPADLAALATAARQDAAKSVLDNILTRLPVALESGRLSVRTDGTVALNSATLAALESISVDALPLPPDAATESTLSGLSGKIGTPGGDDLLSILRDIALNTATEITRTETLELTAEQVQLNTDAVESKLDTISARIGTTGVVGTVAALLDAIRLAQINQAVVATLAAPVSLDSATLAALESITVNNPTDLSTLATNAKQDTQITRLTEIRDFVDTLETINTAVRDRLPSALTGDRLKVEQQGRSVSTNGTLAGIAQTLTLSVDNMSFVSVTCTAGGATTLVWEVSTDGGTTWKSVEMSLSSAANVATSLSIASGTDIVSGNLPAGATHFRARAQTATSVTILITAATSGAPPVTPMAVVGIPSVALSASTAMGGFIKGSGLWVDESSTPLGISGTFTGANFDATNSASGNPQASSASYVKEVRYQAISDVAGTLAIEVSRDSSTWRRVLEVAATVVGGGLYVARIDHLPATRYVRAVYTNGAGAQTHFQLERIAMAI